MIGCKHLIIISGKGGIVRIKKLFMSQKQLNILNGELYRAAGAGNLQQIQHLLSQGADPNYQGGYQCKADSLFSKDEADYSCYTTYTVLYQAARNGKLDIVQHLVEQGKADANARNNGSYSNSGKTPLHPASENGHLHVVQYLIEKCHADVNAKDNRNDTSLHLAVRLGHFHIVQYLVEKCRADVNAKDDGGKTPLHWALQLRLDIAQCLLEKGHPDVNTRDNFGSTLLHIAAIGTKYHIVQYLVEKCHADVNPKSSINFLSGNE